MPGSDESDQPIRVAVVADTTRAAAQITHALRTSGYWVRPFSLTASALPDRIRDLRPSVVVARTGAQNSSVAPILGRIAAGGGPALVLLTPAASRRALKLASDAGALLHLLEPVTTPALVAAIRVAAARARDLRQLRTQLTELRESVMARKVVERAKAVLMRRFGFTEEEAHRRLQMESRNRNRKLIETAWHVIQADAQLSRRRQPAPL